MPTRILIVRILLGLLLFHGAGRAAYAQASGTAALLDSLRPRIEQSVISGSWTALDEAIDRLRAAVVASPDDAALQYDLGYALHRRGSVLLVQEQGKRAKPLLEESERALARSVSLGGGGGAVALRGAVTGQLAGVSGALGAMRFGPRAFRLLDQALELAPNDPRVALLNGITRLNAPKAFGGGPAKGEPDLRRAIALFAADRSTAPAPTWGLVDAHIWLGIALEQLKRYDEARAALEQALSLAPGHVWIERDILPRLGAKRTPR